MRMPIWVVVAIQGLLGCADAYDPEGDLPGDIDHNPAADEGDPAAMAWNQENDPMRLAFGGLQYLLEGDPARGIKPLPVAGRLERAAWRYRYPNLTKAPVAWADTYWPSAQRSHNARWQGPTVQSPLEKYDRAFLGAPGCAAQPPSLCGPGAAANWATYFRCAGPAATWQMQHFQDMSMMFDGVDNNANGIIDACPGKDPGEAAETWWGSCHAWAAAALLEPEPQHAVTFNGVEFSVGDIKALIQNMYDTAQAVSLGGRSHAVKVVHQPWTNDNHPDNDINPGSLHIILTNFLGIHDFPLIEDRTANSEVWNHPIVGYQVLAKRAVAPARAMQCVGATGNRWAFNGNARQLVEVRTRVDYVTESEASATAHGYAPFVRSDVYHYILELGAAGKIIGGKYCTANATKHPDFLWSPWAPAEGANPRVAAAHVQELIRRAAE